MAGEQWLDDLSRTLASGMSRRAMLRRVGGSLVAVALASVLPDVARGAGTTDPDSSGGPGDGSAGTKLKAGGNAGVAAAPSSCPPGETLCGNKCKNLDNDKKNCGACGTHCGPHFHCFAGFCTCDGGFCFHPEDATCKRDTNDPNNCGSCGNVCPNPQNATARCRQGMCDFKCDPGFRDCNGDASDGCETNLLFDPSNCGRCGRTCHPDENCLQGNCVLSSCNDGLHNGQETGTDCGGPTCPPCANGKGCAVDSDCQSGLCDTATLKCRSCVGAKCPNTECCDINGVCVGFCPSGQCCEVTAAHQICVSATTCPNNGCCGGLGICESGLDDNACGDGATCIDCAQSQLGHKCQPNHTCGCDTDQDCAAGTRCETSLHICGGCSASVPCPSGQCCDNGVCVQDCPDPFCCSNGICVHGCPAGQCCSLATSSLTCVASCPSGECCDSGYCFGSCLSGICDNGVCVPCSASHPCPAGENCDNGVCVECSANFPCPGNQCCNNGVCGGCNCSGGCPPDKPACCTNVCCSFCFPDGACGDV